MRGLRLPLALNICIAAATLAAGSPVAAQQRSETAKAQPNGQVQLQPHRAIYDFTLGTVRADKSVSGLAGRMVYEFTGSACEGYSQSMRFVIRTTSASGETSVSDQRSTTWEDDTGMRYRFQSSQYRDQKLMEQAAGTATRGEGDQDTRVDLTHPEPRSTAIGAGAMFPVQHSLKLIDAARRGYSQLTADFFDGSEGGEKTYVVAARIGKAVASSVSKALPRVGNTDKLDAVAAWPVVLSYYEQGTEAKDAVPVYEMSFLFYANGVSRRLVIDNGDYTMKGELSEFSLIDPTPCRR
jgi:hypothetical protein